jgi:hypothetical protein
MRESDVNKKLFHRGHYNVIAKQLRLALEPYTVSSSAEDLQAWAALINLALSMALRFQADNEDFMPEMFLKACSPNPETFPIHESWEQYTSEHGFSVRVTND